MYLTVNGANTYCYTGGKPFDAAKPTVVFIHGVVNDHSVWILQSRYLAHHGWNVLAVDLPGHCKSAGEAPSSVEEAAAFIQAQNVRNSRLSRLMSLIQIRGRSLTAAEERYAQGWLDMGMDDELISMAYERTCLNTGGLNWAYMNKILQRWQQQGFHSAEDVRTGDRKGSLPKGASGQLGQAELEAIQRVLREG